MTTGQIQKQLDRLHLKEMISRYDEPDDFLSDVAEILKELGTDTKKRVADLAEKDELLEKLATRDISYSVAIKEMLENLCYEDL